MIAPPETKRAAPSRATRDTTTHRANDNAAGAGLQYVVYCTKASGARVEFQRYALRDEAEVVARQLRAVGCAATVEATP